MADKFEFEKLKITDSEWEPIKISNVATRPNAKTAYGSGLSAEDTKKLFDRPADLLRKRFNSLTEYAAAEEAARAEAEKERSQAEEERTEREQVREERLKEVESLVGDIDRVLDEILKKQRALIGGAG